MFFASPEILKRKTLALFSKYVRIELKQGSEAYKAHGPYIEGYLICRVWGKEKRAGNRSTVVAVSLAGENDEFMVTCSDIKEISEKRPE